jgi:hypothetical protein
VSERFNLDHHVIVEVNKVFAEHVALPKEGFIAYERPKVTKPTPMVHASVKTVAALTTNGFMKSLLILLRSRKIKIYWRLMRKSAQKSCTPYEQVHVYHNFSTIKALNQEESYDVYLCEDAIGVGKGNINKCGKPIISLLWTL